MSESERRQDDGQGQARELTAGQGQAAGVAGAAGGQAPGLERAWAARGGQAQNGGEGQASSGPAGSNGATARLATLDTSTLAHLDAWLTREIRDDGARLFLRTLMVDALCVDYDHWCARGWPALFDHLDGWARVVLFERARAIHIED